MNRKKLLYLFLAILLMLSPNTLIRAQETAQNGTIFATDMVTSPESTFDVPVCIKDNPGVMGIGLEIHYDDKLLTPVSTKKGAVLQQGMLTDSIGAADYEGKIKVLWSHTENVTENGELFVIQFSVNDQKESLSELEIVCNSADTFNEAWEELKFTTSNASIRVKADVEVTEGQASPTTDVESAAEGKEKSQEKQTSREEQISQEKQADARVNQAMTIRDEVEKQLSKEEVKAEMETALKEFEAEHPKDIPEEEQGRFVQRVSSLLQQKEVDIQSLWENNSSAQKMEVLSYLWEDASGIQSIEKSKEQLENVGNLKTIAVTAIPIIVVIIFGFFLINQKRERRKKHGNKE